MKANNHIFKYLGGGSIGESESLAPDSDDARSKGTNYSPIPLPDLPNFDNLRELQAQLKAVRVKTFRPHTIWP
jgi:hypothetical protein